MPASYSNRPQAQKRRIQELSDLAISRGGKFLSTEYSTVKSKYKWECSKGHIWETSATSVEHQKTWCPVCSKSAPRSLGELKKIVEERGGRLLSTEYTGVDGSYEFLCNLGHKNRNRFKKIEMGQWCSTCNKTSKSEEITRTILENLFECDFPKRRPKWLRNNRGNLMELDGYCEELGIAFEYQGAQHFKNVSHFQGDLDQRIADDATKASLCLDHGVTLLVFTHTDNFQDFHEITKSQLGKFETSKSIDFNKPVNFDSAYIREDRLEELRLLLAPKNISVLSTKWIKVDTKYEFRCEVCKSEWQSRANAYFNSRRVAGCDYCNRRIPSNKLDMNYVREWAERFGGKVKSDIYIGRRAIYSFECQLGHQFDANLNNMISRNQFCPQCENRSIKSKMPTNIALIQILHSKGLEMVGSPQKYTDRVKVICLKCGNSKTGQIGNFLKSTRSCPTCEPHPNIGKGKPRKFTDTQEVSIAASYKNGESLGNLAQEFKVSKTTIRNIVSRVDQKRSK